MDRTLSTFKEAEDRVKINWFTRQGYDINGIVHVGANDGFEIEYYLKMGIKPVLAIEPLRAARKIAFDKYFGNPDVLLCNVALGNFDGQADLYIADGDGKGSSFLKEFRGPKLVMMDTVQMCRWSSLSRQDIDRDKYNCCVIDAQGMELDVLRGMDEQIQKFDFLSVECSLEPIYKGEADVFEVCSYLNRMGFHCDTPMEKLPAHDDVFFINRRVLYPPKPEAAVPNGRKLNIGSGQRRFGQGWVNIDAVSRPGQVPDLLLDVGKDPLPYEDESIDYVVLHQVYEHFGLGEGHALVKECHRVLAPGGSLIITVPNMSALTEAWRVQQIDDYIFMVNVYGAYQGEPGDRHKWGYNERSLNMDLWRTAPWRHIQQFDWRPIEGADIARDWWILGTEAVK